ncbi:hypothetical protein F5J12DRAFT_178272 [Pisolithus orientalis]|uniref:uncharacterized protein n=1 Tax=Pisolithus orientalis TaxID=936130 RepID=UPI002225829C|nr:uncharacterized protein F5J12DRAFT_178272 [Pisolithus orientalis]KAI6032609.1 hypothetical protein F5J12DRAFT_178272 [Pisolithus orientalis]
MDALAEDQRDAVRQLQAVLDSQHYDTDVLVSVLQSVDWSVHSAMELLLDGPHVDSTPSSRSTMSSLDHEPQLPVDRPERAGGRGPPRTLANTIFAVLSLPFHVVTGILRFILGVFRIPFLSLNFGASSYRPPRQPHDSRGAIRRWITTLEEETGAYNIKSSPSVATGRDSHPSTSRRHAYPPANPETTRVLPDFFDGTYDEVLDICQKEGRIACVILVSEEHDDVPAFKRVTLTDPNLVRIMNDNNFVIWGGDVRDKIPWDAAQKLQVTTYPFVAFLALQPRRSTSTSSFSSSGPVLTVLSRHYGPSVPDSGPTSARSLINHLEGQLLPRVDPFLTRYRDQLQERERDRLLREQQDKAYRDSQRRDRERIEAKIRAEREEVERIRKEEEAQREEERRLQAEQERQESIKLRRSQWRRWMRRSIVPPEPRDGNSIRLAIRLPSGRVVRSFPSATTVTALYAFVDSQMIPSSMNSQDDPEHPPEGSGGGIEILEKYIHSQVQGPESWWGFKLALSYPRREIKWKANTSLAEAGLKNGEQLVMEVTSNVVNGKKPLGHDSDDQYESESD